jgi:AAA+ ATPase superfamily predicted ATPase
VTLNDSQSLAYEKRVADVTKIEHLIQQGEARLGECRTVLRQFLLGEAGLSGKDSSIGDAIEILAQDPPSYQLAATVILRYISVKGIIPEQVNGKSIDRATVALCEGALPEFMSFIKLDKRAQTYEKFSAIVNFHNTIVEILNPLRHLYGDLDAILAAKNKILGALNHSILRKYCGPFQINEIKTILEVIFSKMTQVYRMDTTLLGDIEECYRCIHGEEDNFIESKSFLTSGYLSPFLTVCHSVLSDFLKSRKSKIEATIEWGQGPGCELQKRYPLHEPEREIQIAIPLRNVGPGLATDVRVTVTSESPSITLNNSTVMLGNVVPGEFSVTIDVLVTSAGASFQAILYISWGQIGTPNRSEELFEFTVISQRGNIDWSRLTYLEPYGTGVAEGDQFYGRVDKVRQIAGRLLRQPMEPFYITGQKRVGKTSLALASVNYAKTQSLSVNLRDHYILWGEFAHSDPNMALKQLGESIESFISDHISERARPVKGDYNGTLAGLTNLSRIAKTFSPQDQFIIVIDEFDEIHQELFLHGNLAETFFANLRALSRCNNICIVLIGGENMPFIMDRQGQKLNNFSRENLNYFSRQNEWSDFQLLIRSPTSNILNWHDDAISEIFNITHGNPYFAKIICSAVFRSAVSERDADITAAEVRRAIEIAISGMGTNSFQHLWQDGISKANADREPDILRRMRVLVALARCLLRNLSTNISNIVENRSSTSLPETEIPAILNDFQRREVIREKDGYYVFELPIFCMWLVDIGVSQLISDKMNEELANISISEENKAVVLSKEVVELANDWPTYRGRHIGTDQIRSWYQQVESPREQRLLFKLLKRIYVFNESKIRERLTTAHGILKSSLPEFIIRKRGARRFDVIVTYVDGEGKSGASYASLYAEENGIAADCVIGCSDFRLRLNQHVDRYGKVAAIIIIDDIAATGRSLANHVHKFICDFKDLLSDTKVRVITLVATSVAQGFILGHFKKIDGIDLDFRSCEILSNAAYAFPPDYTGWSSEEEMERAKDLCINLGSRIYKNSPLGYGGLGLLVVFPTTVPNNSLPILHTFARAGSDKQWNPLFPRVIN